MEERYNIGKVHQFFIDQQVHYADRKFASEYYPKQFDEAKEWISGLSLDRDICLVGAGFIGKIYCVLFKDVGGIGIDIGHVFDKWYGMKTRGVGGKRGVTSKEYKL